MALSIRFGVGSDTGPQSSQWSFFTNKKGDVYLSMRQLGGIVKYSLHASGICRSAFTQEHGTPPSLPDRLIFKWKRPSTSADGPPALAFVIVIAFPTNFLSAPKKPDKPVRWVTPADSGNAMFVAVAFSSERTDVAEERVRSLGYEVVASDNLLSGESVLLVSRAGSWDNDDLTVPGEHQDLLFLNADPRDGRPIRILLGGPADEDGGLRLTELGGYAEKKSAE